MDAVVEYILTLFKNEPERKQIPSGAAIGRKFSVSAATITGNFEKIHKGIQDRIQVKDFDEKLKTRLERAILINTNFPLAAAQVMIEKFEKERRRTELPTQPEIGEALGVSVKNLVE